MKYRRFGRSGLEVSELVFGGGYVGGLLIHAHDDVKQAAVRRALGAGINWIDTAPAYGNGKSEEALGWLLQEVEETPYISTKVNLDTARLDDLKGQLERSLHDSLRRLRRERVDLFQLHNRIEEETVGRALAPRAIIGRGGVADALDRLREQGLVRLIGITALGDAASCCEVIASGRFDSAQVYYNLLNPSAGHATPAGWSGHDFGGVIATCRAHDVAVMNIRVLAAGVLASEQRTGREIVIVRGADISAEERRARAVFETLGSAYGTRAQTAIRFALANPDIAGVIVGLAELAHLEEALAAAALGPLPAAALERLQPLYASDFGRWQRAQAEPPPPGR